MRGRVVCNARRTRLPSFPSSSRQRPPSCPSRWLRWPQAAQPPRRLPIPPRKWQIRMALAVGKGARGSGGAWSRSGRWQDTRHTSRRRRRRHTGHGRLSRCRESKSRRCVWSSDLAKLSLVNTARSGRLWIVRLLALGVSDGHSMVVRRAADDEDVQENVTIPMRVAVIHPWQPLSGTT